MHLQRPSHRSSSMRSNHRSLWLVLCLVLSVAALSARPLHAQEIRVDIPVVLKEAKIVFNLDHMAFEGHEPTGLQFLRVMIPYFKKVGTKTSIVAVFHGAAG